MSRATTAQFLHVANGGATTSIIGKAGIPGDLSLWADVLYEGPVPGGISDEELIDVRADFLAGPDHPAAEVAADLRRWRAAFEAHTSYDELVLWFEHDLFDQLNLVHLLTCVRARVPREKVVSLVCIGSFPGHPRFKGLGELSPRELAPLIDARRRVNEEQYVLAERTWAAFREPTPEALEELLRSDTSALPFLARALTRFLQEYPWLSDGLSRTERNLLQLADDGIDLRAAFPRMQDGEDAYYVTDGTLSELASSLASPSPALLTMTPPPEANTGLLDGRVHITDAGRSVLAGEQDRVETFGIDRWLGGVHLRSGEVDWRWDHERGRVTTR